MVRSQWLMGNGTIAGSGRAVHHVSMDDSLKDAIASLAAFRASCDDELIDELIDEESKLTSAKLDLILAQLSWPEGEPEVSQRDRRGGRPAAPRSRCHQQGLPQPARDERLADSH
jgi:hypothetical protein